MATIIEELGATFGLDVKGEQFLRAQIALDSVKWGLRQLSKVARATFEFLPRVAMETAESFDRIDEASQKSGVAVEPLQELAYAAEFSSLSLDDLGNGLKFLSVNMAEAKGGSKEMRKAFRSVGAAWGDGKGGLASADSVLLKIADRFQSMPDGAKKAALATKLFGKAGAGMIPFLNAGSKAIALQRAEARKLGLVYDKDVIQQGVAAADAQTRLAAAWRGLKMTLGVALLPALAQGADALAKWIAKNRELIGIKFRSFLEGAVEALRWVGDALQFVYDHSTAFKIGAGVIIGALVAMRIAAFATSAAMVFSPGGLVLVGLAAVAAAVLLIATNWNEVKQAAEDAAKAMVAGSGGAGAVEDVVGAIGDGKGGIKAGARIGGKVYDPATKSFVWPSQLTTPPVIAPGMLPQMPSGAAIPAPSIPARPAAGAAGNKTITQHNSFSIIQQPGESDADFGKRIADELKKVMTVF